MASNLSNNYEKIVLVLALLVALGLGTMAYLKAGKLKGDFETPGGRMLDAPPLPGENVLADAKDNLVKPHVLNPAVVDGRTLDTYTGIPWFLKKGETEPVDLGNPNEGNVHPPIPNIFWLDNKIDPGFADSPQRDPDGDGFSNEEEFLAKTGPNDPKSYGDLSTKIELVKLIKEPYRLELSSESSKQYVMKYEDAYTGRRRQLRSPYIPAGDEQRSIFFEDPPVQFKFRLVKVEQRRVKNERTGIESDELFATVEVLNGPKKGVQYEIPRSNKKYIIRDYKVILVLNAIGEGGNQFEVAENDTFSLPFDSEAAEKPYKFKGLDDAGGVIIEWEADGAPQSTTLTP